MTTTSVTSSNNSRLPPNSRIGFIGSGVMATSIINGLLSNQSIDPNSLYTSDTDLSKLQSFKLKGINTTTDNRLLAQQCNIIILAVKPAVISIVLKQLYNHININNHLIISIAAGVLISSIEQELPAGSRVIRVMPNTPALVSAAATAYSLGKSATNNDSITVNSIFTTIGPIAILVNESDLDAVTGLSGSGPAYIFLLIESLADGGVRSGLTRSVALELAIQTVLGSALLVQSSKLHPAQLKDQVASPGGTTIAGIAALESAGFRSAIINAVTAATNRSIELGKKSKAAAASTAAATNNNNKSPQLNSKL